MDWVSVARVESQADDAVPSILLPKAPKWKSFMVH